MELSRWKDFSLQQKIGHVGSEIGRARVWEAKSNEGSRQAALLRVLDLIDLSLACSSGPQLREWARLREVLCDSMLRAGIYRVSLSELERYSLQFLT